MQLRFWKFITFITAEYFQVSEVEADCKSLFVYVEHFQKFGRRDCAKGDNNNQLVLFILSADI